MGTKLERLRRTLSHAHQTWQAEQRCQEQNAVNESAWSAQVIEPVLAALDWPRLLQSEKTTGAYFEWPKDGEIDVVLLSEGKPMAYAELKQHKEECSLTYMRDRLDEHEGLNNARYALAAWYGGDAGFRLYDVLPNRQLRDPSVATLSDTDSCVALLARLAFPVLNGQVRDIGSWLTSFTESHEPLVQRFTPRDVQSRFFSLLRQTEHISKPLNLRRSITRNEPPSPTFAFTELPGVLPEGWGVVFDIYPTINVLRFRLYQPETTEPVKKKNVQPWSFDGRDLNDEALLEFIDQHVSPFLAAWRQTVMEKGLLKL